MNNRPKITKLAGDKAHSTSIKRSLLTDLVTYEHLQTTKHKAKSIIPLFDELINLAKNNETRIARNKLQNILFSELAVDKVLDVFVKRFNDEKSGFVNVYKLGKRKGDNSEVVKLVVKGYVYKEIGEKSKSKAKKKTEKKESKTQAFETQNVIDSKESKSQVVGNTNKAKSNSRSGI